MNPHPAIQLYRAREALLQSSEAHLSFVADLTRFGFRRNAGASTDAVASASQALGRNLSIDDRRLYLRQNGGEGFVGSEYIRLWPIEQWSRLNVAYEVREYLPDIVLIGSNGGGDAYAFDIADDSMPVVRVPFVPFDRGSVSFVSSNVDTLFRIGQIEGETSDLRRHLSPNERIFGMEVFEIKPISLGGNPTALSNKTLLTVDQHVELVVWWNRQFRAQSPV